jgi:hypothetical protein
MEYSLMEKKIILPFIESDLLYRSALKTGLIVFKILLNGRYAICMEAINQTFNHSK